MSWLYSPFPSAGSPTTVAQGGFKSIVPGLRRMGASSGTPSSVIIQLLTMETGMLTDIITKNSTDRSVVVRIIDSTNGTPETGVVWNTSGIDLWYRREGATLTSITEASLTALSDAHSDGGFLHIGHGYYRLDLPDAAVATGANYVDIGGTVTGMIVIGGRIKLVNVNLEDSVRAGMTALPNAAAEASGGLATLSAAQASNGTINVNVHRWLTGTPNSLQSGRVDGYVGAVASGVIAAGSFAANALDAVWSTTTRILTAGTNIVLAKGTGVTGFNDLSAAQVNAEADTALSDVGLTSTVTGRIDTTVSSRLASASYTSPPSASTIAAAVWDYLTSAATTVGSLGKLIVDNINATISSRLASASYTAPLDAAGTRSALGLASANLDTQLGDLPTAAENADAVWDEAISGHLTAGSTGNALNAAGSAGDPWSTSLPGSYGSGTAGKIIGDNLNATVSSRLASASYTAPLDASGIRSALGMASADLDTQLDTLPTASENATAVWASATRVLTAGTNIVLAKGTGVTGFNDLSAAQVNTEVDTALSDVGLTSTITGRIDASVSSRASQTSVDTVDTNVDSILDDTGTSGVIVATNNDKTGYAIGAGGIGSGAFASGAITAASLNSDAVDEILDEQIGDGTITARQALKLLVAALGGKVSGAGTSTITIRNYADTTDVVVASVDGSGNRTSTTVSL